MLSCKVCLANTDSSLKYSYTFTRHLSQNLRSQYSVSLISAGFSEVWTCLPGFFFTVMAPIEDSAANDDDLTPQMVMVPDQA